MEYQLNSFGDGQAEVGIDQEGYKRQQQQQQQAEYSQTSQPQASTSRLPPVRGPSLFEDWQPGNLAGDSAFLQQDFQGYSGQLDFATTSAGFQHSNYAEAPLDWQQQTAQAPLYHKLESQPSPFLANSQGAHQPLTPLSIPTIKSDNPFSPITPAINKLKAAGIIADPAIPDSDPFSYPWNLLDITQNAATPKSELAQSESNFGSYYTPSYGSRSSFGGSDNHQARDEFRHLQTSSGWQKSPLMNDALSVYSDAVSQQASPAPSPMPLFAHEFDPMSDFGPMSPKTRDATLKALDRNQTLSADQDCTNAGYRSNFLGSKISISPQGSPRLRPTDLPTSTFSHQYLTTAALDSPAFTVASSGNSTGLARLAIPCERPSIEIECATATAGPATARPGYSGVLDRMIAEAQEQKALATSQGNYREESTPASTSETIYLDDDFVHPPNPRRGRSHSEADATHLLQDIANNNEQWQNLANTNAVDSSLLALGDNGMPSFAGPRRHSHTHERHLPYESGSSRSVSPNPARGHRPTQSDSNAYFLHPQSQPQLDQFTAPRFIPNDIMHHQAMDYGRLSAQNSPLAGQFFHTYSDQFSPAPTHLTSEGCPSPALSHLSYDPQLAYDQNAYSQNQLFEQPHPQDVSDGDGASFFDDGTEITDQPVHVQSQTTKATKQAAAARRKAGTEARYVCDYCGETFTRNYNLRGHLRAHNGSKPFTCTEPGCDKAFARAHDLKRHSALHTSISKYKCLSCERSFKRLDALQRHHRSEAGQNCVAKLLADGVVNPKQNGLIRVTQGGLHL